WRISRSVSDVPRYNTASPWRAPSIRNCSPSVVFPAPLDPRMSENCPRGYPPPRTSSNPAIPLPANSVDLDMHPHPVLRCSLTHRRRGNPRPSFDHPCTNGILLHGPLATTRPNVSKLKPRQYINPD